MRHLISRLLIWIGYYCGIDELFYWLNRKAKRILVFHNVLPDGMFRDGIANGVSLPLSTFKMIVNECAKHFYFTSNVLDKEGLTITFDDGFQNQYAVAYPYLREKKIPAVLFITGKTMSGGEPLIIDQLMHWVDEAPIELVDSRDRGKFWREKIWPEYLSDVSGCGRNVLSRLDKQYPMDKIMAKLPYEYRNVRLGGIRYEQLSEMKEHGWRIGWHTNGHFPLSLLGEKDIHFELECPEICRGECLSYPYGHFNLVGEKAIQVAKKNGYPCAVSNVSRDSLNLSRYFLPRIAPPRTKAELHYVMSGFGQFLHSLKLIHSDY